MITVARLEDLSKLECTKGTVAFVKEEQAYYKLATPHPTKAVWQEMMVKHPLRENEDLPPSKATVRVG